MPALIHMAKLLFHRLAGTADLALNEREDTPPEYGYQVLLVNATHSAAEGVAIGAAMLVSLPFGIFVAIAIAAHNIPEAMVLTDIFAARGVRPLGGAALAVAANAPQVLFAVAVFAIGVDVVALVPLMLGFSVGALIYLVMADLLPESYREAGHTSIALVTVLAMGVLVLLRSQVS